MQGFAFTTTGWALNLATKLTKADVRMHNLEVLEEDMSVMYVVNHFTRLETIILPYQLYKNTGKEVWSLAASELFVGRIGDYLRDMGTVSTKDPDRDKVIVHSLLRGIHPWIIFPEGQMIKDKKVVDPAGVYAVYNEEDKERRPPHKGAAALALLAEFYRYKIRCIYDSPGQEGLEEIVERFGLESVEEVLKKRTVVVPVNITYFPIRARDNAVLRIAQGLAKGLSERAIEELSVEGTFLSEDTDIDITLGEPIDMAAYLNQPEHAELMACGDDLQKMEQDPKSLFHEAANELMLRYMQDIYSLTRVNYDHIFATIIRHQGTKPFTERAYRNRIFMAAYEIQHKTNYSMHGILERTYQNIIFEDPSPKFHSFMSLCLKEGIIEKRGDYYIRNPHLERGASGFHSIRGLETSYVIANEIEPLEDLVDIIEDTATMRREDLSRKIRTIFLDEDLREYEEDYDTFKIEESLGKEVGRPFLLTPEHPKAGIVLVHGYMASPLEVRALAEFLVDRGYVVYCVRLKGHGTAPEDLAQTPWEDWYTSFNRGYVIIKTLTDRIILGGFSTGGCMALMGGGLKGEKVDAVFSINAPTKLRQYTARLASKVVTMNNLLKKIRRGKEDWDYVANDPENPHINYKRNPVSGVAQLGEAMEATEAFLPSIVAPTLIIQASKDPVVHPSSGPDLFDQVGTRHKELAIFERDRHGIINGDGSETVFSRVNHFLDWALQQPKHSTVAEEIEVEVPENAIPLSSEAEPA